MHAVAKIMSRITSKIMSALVLTAISAGALACDLPEIGSGRVVSAIDGRTLRLDDDREIRLTGVALPRASADRQRAVDALAEIATGKTIVLRAETDAPDRYGRQHAIVMRDTTSLQAQLLARGVAFASPLAPSQCAVALRAAEAEARAARSGIWATGTAIKNAERPGDILAAIGQFAIVDGTVRSVREAGGVTYVNFGRRWTEDFAASFAKRAVTAFEADGRTLKSLENRRLRVRGWINRRMGPRIDVFRLEQIEVLGDNESRPGSVSGRTSGRNRTSE